MNDWKQSDDDPQVWIYKDKYTLKRECLTWYLYDGDETIAHTHVKPSYYVHPAGDVPKVWAEIVVGEYEVDD